MTNQLRCWAEINIDALENNMKIIRKNTNSEAKVMAVVKADAYGHGAILCAKTLLSCGADWLGVATVPEGVQLRNAGIYAPILVLGAIPAEHMKDAVSFDIITAVFDYENAKELSGVAESMGKKAKVHIKTDSGMNRIGIQLGKGDYVEKIKAIKSLPGLEANGIFSHLACSDTNDRTFTLKQIKIFEDAIENLAKQGISFDCKHIANSAAIFKYPEAHFDMVRAGIVSYGYLPSSDTNVEGLVPAMSFKCNVSFVKTIEQGEYVSYGATYRADELTDIATLTVGYADGYSRVLSDKAEVLIKGKKVKVVGRICMDQCMVDVSSVNNIAVGDVATLFGKDGNEIISVEEIAEKLGTINYEVLCMVSRRVLRLYVKDGKCVSKVNYII